MRIKRIVVPVDFTGNSVRAVDFAADLAQPFGAELVAIFAVEPLVHVSSEREGSAGGTVAALLEQQRRSGRAELARLEQRFARRRVKLRTVMATGRASQVIVDTARRLKADLIVMATHGRRGLPRLLLGSVTERVLRAASCPVLTMHADDVRTVGRRPARRAPAAPRAARAAKRTAGRRR